MPKRPHALSVAKWWLMYHPNTQQAPASKGPPTLLSQVAFDDVWLMDADHMSLEFFVIFVCPLGGCSLNGWNS